MVDQDTKTGANLSRRLDEKVTPVVRDRLARFNEVGDWIARLVEHIRFVFVLVLVFALACLCVGLFVSSDAAQAVATGTGAILAGWAVLQIVRSDDAGFQTVEQQKRFLIAYATCLTGLKAQLEPIAERGIEPTSFRATFTPYLHRLDRFSDGEFAILMALAAHTNTVSKSDADRAEEGKTQKEGMEALFSDFLDLRVMLGALVSNDPTLIDVSCIRFESSARRDASVQSGTELQALLLDRVNSTLGTLKSVDADRLRDVYAQMRRTTNFLGLIDASARPATPPASRTLDELTSDICHIFGPDEHPMISWYTSRLSNKRTADREFSHRGSWMDEAHVLWLYQTHSAAIAALNKSGGIEAIANDLREIADRDCLRKAGDR